MSANAKKRLGRKKKTAFITGITGQDGSYLAELLLAKGYEVHAIIRRSSSFNTGRIMHIFEDPHNPKPRLHLHYGDLTDGVSMEKILVKIQPDEIYNLGAQSHVRVSFDVPIYTLQSIVLGTAHLLEAVKNVCDLKKVRFYQSSSSEMYGLVQQTPQSEKTPFYPRSPYAVAKVGAHWLTVNYREAYGLFACNGILFNHESPRRGETFVTRKITRGVARILSGKDKYLYLGNLDAKRDWGYAPDYVEGMWRMMQHKKPEDFVLATGQTHTVREFVQQAFSLAGLDWKKYVKIDKRYYRPSEVDLLKGNPAKARRVLGWKPKVGFKELVKVMLEADCADEGIAF